MGRLIDRLLLFEARHQRGITLVLGVMFALGCADYAGFITLPELSLLGEWTSIALAAVFNAVWYGFALPAVERRRKSVGLVSAAQE